MKKLLILSGKGGTGKTTTAAAFICFAQARAAADCDVDAPNLHLVARLPSLEREEDFTGSEKAVIDPERCIACGACLAHCRFGAIRKEPDRYRVLEHACEGCGVCALVCLQQAVSLSPDISGRTSLYRDGSGVFSTARLKMGRGNSGKLVTAVKSAMVRFAGDVPLAIVDGSPGIGCPVIASVTGMDLVLLVAEPSLSGIHDLERLWQTTDTLGTKTAVCVNRWDVSPECTKSIQNLCRERGVPFVGTIPYDRSAGEAVNAGVSLADRDGPASRALRRIFQNTMALLELS